MYENELLAYRQKAAEWERLAKRADELRAELRNTELHLADALEFMRRAEKELLRVARGERPSGP